MDSRNQYFDFLRGIAIIMVVGIHTFFRQPTFDSCGEIAAVAIRQMLNCAVPLFFAISGFFLGQKKLNTFSEIMAFYKKQIPKIYIPVLIWSIPDLINRLINGSHHAMLYILMMFCCAFSIYYFVFAIVQYYLLLPLLRKFNNRGGVFVSILMSMISVVLHNYYTLVLGNDLPLIVKGGIFPFWIMFFMIGLYLSNHNRNYALTLPVCCTVAGIVLQVIETYYHFKIHGNGFGIKTSSFLYAAAIITMFFSTRMETLYSEKNIIVKIIRRIGNISFGVYLTHMFVLYLISHLVKTDYWSINWILTFMLIRIAQKILPDKVIKYLGLF